MKPLDVVIAVIRDSATGNLLFQERQKLPYKGYLGLVGGKVESGEKQETAISREIREEADLKVTRHKYVDTIHETLVSNGGTNEVALHIYLADVSGEINANLEEGQIHWIDKKHFHTNKSLFIPSDWLVVDAVINSKKLFSRILVEDNGSQYEIKQTS